ncbi:hypothetical protein DFP72DRAFT_904090 [Ephemerocybe angulata]|uniref:Uncharacterized protein n=1 Tax=Ephemerocybe angulata TaxID=980116 RepID=A0A8H6HUD6_9AGAR|nr:hypothetical protein DFP72DRAFT_904090 [Tulosesus angulatus]
MQSLQPATPIEQVSDLSNEEVQSAHIDVGPMPRAIELAPWDVSPGTQTAPAEVLHRRSPYNLRRTVRTEGLRARIREQLRPTVYAFDKHYLALAKIKKTNPKLQYPPTNVKLLYSSISPISLGITLAQFGSILRLCQSCDRYLFVERCRTHKCSAPPVNIREEGLYVPQLMMLEDFGGLTAADIKAFFQVCDTCCRVFSQRFAHFHECPGAPGEADL